MTDEKKEPTKKLYPKEAQTLIQQGMGPKQAQHYLDQAKKPDKPQGKK